jgi:hypothetical protein
MRKIQKRTPGSVLGVALAPQNYMKNISTWQSAAQPTELVTEK